MKELRIYQSESHPGTLIDLHSGYWYYNFNISSKKTLQTLEWDPDNPREITLYSYNQLRVFGKPTYKKCVELIIREYLTQSQEFDLINSYNRAMANILTGEEAEKAKQDYFNYLQKLDEIKALVRADFKDDSI